MLESKGRGGDGEGGWDTEWEFWGEGLGPKQVAGNGAGECFSLILDHR